MSEERLPHALSHVSARSHDRTVAPSHRLTVGPSLPRFLALTLFLCIPTLAFAGDWREPEKQGIRLPAAVGAARLDPESVDGVLCLDREGRILAQRAKDVAGLLEMRELTGLSDFLAAVSAMHKRAGSPVSDAVVLIQADEATRWDALARLLASCAGQRLWRISFAVAAADGLAAVPAHLPIDKEIGKKFTSVRLSLKAAADGHVQIAIGRKTFSSPDELTTALETLQALFPGLHLILNIHSDFPYRELVRVLGLARATGFPGVEFSGSFVEPDEHPLVNTGVVVDPSEAIDVSAAHQDEGPKTDRARPTPSALPGDGSRLAWLKSGGGSEATEAAVRAGLGWLVRHQSADGAWSSHAFADGCKPPDACSGRGYKSYDVGVTALALDALVTAGCWSAEKPDPTLAAAANLAIGRLLGWQEPGGGVGSMDTVKPMYNHALATLALCEAYRLSGRDGLREPAQRAVDFLLAAQSPSKGWRYKPQAAEHDTSVTGWCLTALAAARTAGLRGDAGIARSLVAYFDEVSDTRYSRVGYTGKEDAGLKITIPGKNDAFVNHDTMTAIGILGEILLDNREGAPMLGFQADLLVQDLPRWDKLHHTDDYYYWYYATMALYALEGLEGSEKKKWNKWNSAVAAVLVQNQTPAAGGCAAGSWDADDRWSFEGGRIYATAINVLTLETYYRLPGLMGKK